MSIKELGEKLSDKYNNAAKGKKAVSIHLFGIKYADVIKKNNYPISEIIESAGLYKSYVAELNKGINLSQYVEIKEAIADRLV